MDWNLPDDEAATIAGLVIHEARAIPEPKQTFTFHGFRFEVLRRQRNRISALRVTPLLHAGPTEAPDEEGETDDRRLRPPCGASSKTPAATLRCRGRRLPYIGARAWRGGARKRFHVLEQSRRRPWRSPGRGRGGRAGRPAASGRSRGMLRRAAGALGSDAGGSGSGERAAAERPARLVFLVASSPSCSGSPGARSTPSSPTRSASISCSAATPARPRPGLNYNWPWPIGSVIKAPVCGPADHRSRLSRRATRARTRDMPSRKA